MSASRDTILAALRAASPPAPADPLPPLAPSAPPDLLEALRRRLEEAGGVLVREGEPGLGHRLAGIAGEAAHLYSELDGLPGRGRGRAPATAAELAGIDLAVLPGDCVVAESGAVWQVPARPFSRVAALLAEHLVLVASETDLVPTLHEAYARVELRAPFAWFLTGPSKTADIEQALVHGAHGPARLTLVLVGPGVGAP